MCSSTEDIVKEEGKDIKYEREGFEGHDHRGKRETSYTVKR